jgi:hypothetical protein
VSLRSFEEIYTVSSSGVVLSVITTLTFHYQLPLTDHLRDTFFGEAFAERQIYEGWKTLVCETARFTIYLEWNIWVDLILRPDSNFPQASISIKCSRYSGSSSLHMRLELNQAGTPARGLIKVRYYINETMVKANLLAQHTRVQS